MLNKYMSAVKYMSILLQRERNNRIREGERKKGGNMGGRKGRQKERRRNRGTK